MTERAEIIADIKDDINRINLLSIRVTYGVNANGESIKPDSDEAKEIKKNLQTRIDNAIRKLQSIRKTTN